MPGGMWLRDLAERALANARTGAPTLVSRGEAGALLALAGLLDSTPNTGRAPFVVGGELQESPEVVARLAGREPDQR